MCLSSTPFILFPYILISWHLIYFVEGTAQPIGAEDEYD